MKALFLIVLALVLLGTAASLNGLPAVWAFQAATWVAFAFVLLAVVKALKILIWD